MEKNIWRMSLLALATPAVVLAADPSSATLATSGDRARWSGTVTGAAVSPPPEACAVLQCDTFDVSVDLDPAFWATNSGGLEVSIQWQDETDDLDLYVYAPDGSVTKSSGFGSRAESVRITAPAQGTYHAVVVPASASGTRYDGLTEFETTFPQVQGDRLPNLVALKPRNPRFRIGTYTLTPINFHDVEGSPSCYPDEIADGAERCLRFDAGAENDGDGRFELRIDVGSIAGDRRVDQAIYRSDGTKRYQYAGVHTFHPTHAHFHYKNFAHYELYAVDGSGNDSAAPVARSRKADFCMIDVELRRWQDGDTQGNDARQGAFPDCNVPSELDTVNGKAYMVEGISRGWADVYVGDLPGQYIEVSGVPDGTYDIVVQVNPSGIIAEKTLADDVSCTRVEIAGDRVTEAAVQPVTCPVPAAASFPDTGPIDIPHPPIVGPRIPPFPALPRP